MTNISMNHSKIGRILSENIDDLIFILNEKYNCEYNNFQQYPFSKKINDFVHPQDFKRVSRLLKDIFRTGYGSEEVQIKYNGNPFKWFEIKGKSFIDSEHTKKKALLICRDISKYKKLEVDLKKSQASFDEITGSLPEIQFWRLLQSRKGINVVQQTSEMIQLVFDNIPQLICWKDTNLVYMGCNKNFALLNKLTEPMSIIGRKDEDLIWHNGNFNSFIEKEQEVIVNDKPEYNAIESLLSSKGAQIWFEINRIPIHNSKNQVVGILITYEDITNRKINEQKLEESESKYRGILENMKETYFEVDLKGNYGYINSAFIDLVGYSKNEVKYKKYSDYVDEETKNKIFKVYNEVYRTSKSKNNFQFQIQKKNGDLAICESSVNLRYDSEGNKIGFSGLARDVTEKYVLEQKLRESEKKYRHLFENASYSIILVNRRGEIIDCNPTTEILFKIKKDDLIHKNFLYLDIKPQKILSLLSQRYESILKGNIPDPLEIQIIRAADGSLIWISISESIVEFGGETIFQVIIQDITEKKNSEQELKKSQEELTILNKELEKKVLERTKDLIESEQQYRTTINSLNDPLHVINKDLTIILANTALNDWLVDLGIENDLVERKIFEAFPFLPDKVYEEYEYVFNSGKMVVTEESNILNEKEIFTETRKIPIFSEGIVEQVITIIKDITESKKLEIQLKESEENYRNITEQSLVGILVLQDGYLKYFNKIVSEVLGYTDEEIKNWEPNEFAKTIHPKDLEFVMEQIRKKQLGDPDIVNQYNYRILRKNGEIRWIEVYSKTINYEGRQADLAITRDITDKVQTEQELKESEENFQDMITNLEEAYYKVKWEGNLIYHNPAFNKIAGYDLHENLIGQPPPLFWESSADREEYFEKLLKDGYIRNHSLPLKRKDDEKIVVQVNARLIKDENNNPIAIEGTFSDITEKFRLEQELFESEKKLRQQNIELKKLDKIKNDFITMAAHELKTPLISISGYTDYILMKHRNQLNKEVTMDLLTVQRNVNRLEILMDQLLEVMKIDEDKLKLQKELIDVSKIINNCLDELSYLINEKNLEVILNIEPKIFLNVDPTRIFTVFTNLISNAIKFTPDYGWIKISAIKKENHYIFEVKDNGIGLAQEDIGRLFKKFERIRPPLINNHINIKDSGTGLGLYITKGIIKTHGGTIRAESEGLDKGSKFIFTLPL
ncbi:MAG: PAS domain S-box protein [Promethearchaeota archaeon]